MWIPPQSGKLSWLVTIFEGWLGMCNILFDNRLNIDAWYSSYTMYSKNIYHRMALYAWNRSYAILEKNDWCPAPPKASCADRKSSARLAGDGGPGREVLARSVSGIQPFLPLPLFTFLRAWSRNISVLLVMYILWLNMLKNNLQYSVVCIHYSQMFAFALGFHNGLSKKWKK